MKTLKNIEDLIGETITKVYFDGHEMAIIVTEDSYAVLEKMVARGYYDSEDSHSMQNSTIDFSTSSHEIKKAEELGIITKEETEKLIKELEEKDQKEKESRLKQQEEREKKEYEKLKAKFEK